LLEHLAASPGSRYSPALRSLRLVAGGRCTADQLAAAAIWALLGAWPHDGYEEHPAVRFDRVVQLLHDQGWPDGDAPVRRLYGEWDRQLERKSVFQTLRESIARDREFLTTLARLRKESKAGQPRGSGEGFKDAARIYTRYSHARADCVKLFNASPDTYVQASLYLKDTIHKLISPPLMIDFKGSIRPTVDACTAMGWKVWLGNEATEEHPASARIVIPKTRLPGKRQRRPKIAFEASAKLAAADVLFSPLRLTFDDADRALAQQALPHIRLISAPRYHRAS
jgi:hypothetical protein